MEAIAYKFELRPNASQRHKFAVFAGQSRFVWNELLRMIQERRDSGEKMAITPFSLSYLVTELKQKFEWLKEAHVHCLHE